jgi:hypothetical protein
LQEKSKNTAYTHRERCKTHDRARQHAVMYTR